MTTMTKIFIGGAGIAALAGATSATAQFPIPNRGQSAVNQCTAAVQNRLDLRAAYGDRTGGRVISVTRVNYRGSRIQVRGLASSRAYAYGPYGVGLYGILGATQANQVADLTFRCSVDHFGRIRDIDINRR